MNYAGFCKRTAAYIIDGVIYGIASSVIGQFAGLFITLAMGISTQGNSTPSLAALVGALGVALAVQFACFVAYFVWPESSVWQATIGKKLMGLVVTDLNGQRISFWRSLGRNLGMIVSSLILGIGYLMCIWTEKKQCLHDTLANCLVIDKTPHEKQGCVLTVIIGTAVLLAGSVILGIAAALLLPSFMGGLNRAQEKAQAAQASAFLSRIQNLQQLYKDKHTRYATDWYDFNMPLVEDTTFCLSPLQTCNTQQKFQVLLTDNAVVAVRINTTRPYELTLPYTPNAPVSCSSQSDPCEKLGFWPANRKV